MTRGKGSRARGGDEFREVEGREECQRESKAISPGFQGRSAEKNVEEAYMGEQGRLLAVHLTNNDGEEREGRQGPLTEHKGEDEENAATARGAKRPRS